MIEDRRDRWLIGAMAWLVFVAVANTTATAVSQPDIERTFGAAPSQVGAVIYAYVGAFAVATALYGRIGARVGHVRALVVGVSILALGAAAAAAAPTLLWLVAARLVQGLGAGAIPTLALSVLARRFRGPVLARAFGLYVMGVGFGQASGPLLGGVLIDTASWRAAVALGLLGIPGALVVLRVGSSPPRSSARVDGIGGGLLLATIVVATWLISRLAALALGPATLLGLLLAALLAGLLLTHLLRHPDPFIPAVILRSVQFRRLATLGARGQALFLAVITGVPLVLGEGGRVTGVALGVLLVPMALTIALTSPRNGQLVARIGRERTTAVALSCLVAGALAAAFAGSQGGTVAVAMVLILVGLGFGLLNAPLSREVSELFGEVDRPMALATFNLAFFGGGALGSAVAAGGVALLPTNRGMGLLLAIGLLSVSSIVGAVGGWRRPVTGPG